jgi:antirestriction protein ArdC
MGRGSDALNLKPKGEQIMEKTDLYSRITNRIIAQLESGAIPWQRPWNAEHAAGRITRPLRHNGTPYRGINVLNLWCEAQERGYSNPFWMTYKQAQELAGQVRKGEKSAFIVFASKFTTTEANDKGEDTERDIPFLKGYAVFNVEQIDNLPAHFYQTANQGKLDIIERDAAADAFLANIPADIRHGGNRAYYVPSRDFIQLPPFESFRDAESYYGTLAHEATHWTGHESRLNRDLSKRFGSEAYAAEELIAELGSAYLSADLHLRQEPREDHASYIGNWLKVLRNDKRAIFTAAAAAERAADLLHSYQPRAQTQAAADAENDRPAA